MKNPWCSGTRWFRIFGVGLAWVSRGAPMLFAERYGHERWYRVGGYRFKVLK